MAWESSRCNTTWL